MSRALANDYSNLQDHLLQIWIPVVGARTPFEFCVKNCEKWYRDALLGQIGIPRVLLNLFERNLYGDFSKMFFDVSFENCFDSQPPFQLDEMILTGSLSDGLFIFANEPPDVDFICVLGNIMFSQKEQKSGCLLLREDTPFVSAYVLEKETKEAWREFLHDGCKEDEQQQISSRKIKKN